ncbi:MAG: carbohydrate ABC transporter permease [Bacilli bacterium]|nr:carbohydrate ABC transporter permease [Bacilli bacterium]
MKKLNKQRLKRTLFGIYGNDGLVFKIVLYLLLIGISFIFLYPLLRMLASSFMNLEDLIDPTSIWIPKHFNLQNYVKSWYTLNAIPRLWDSLIVTLSPTICIIVSSSLIGYGFAKFTFPFKRILMGILVGMFLVPTILLAIPTYVIFREIHLLNSLKAFNVPALLGFGLRQTIFILIFYQFFRQIPNELIEAAEVDGANTVRIFLTIAIPLSLPAFLICFLYSFVWYWNETSLATMYFGEKYTTLPMAVENFRATYELLYPSGSVGLGAAHNIFNQGVLFAGIIISIIPLLIIYFVAQKWFIEGVDRSGIAGM